MDAFSGPRQWAAPEKYYNSPVKRWLPVAFLAAFTAQGALIIAENGAVYDEPVHMAAAHSYWTSGLGLFTLEHPPLTDYLRGIPLLALNPARPHAPGREDMTVTPHVYGQYFLFFNRIPARSMLRAARWASLLTGLFLGIVLWRWAEAAGGKNAGLAAAFIFACEPNLLAHSGLALTDIGVTAFSAAALALWWRYLEKGGVKIAALAGIAAGAALASKATGLAVIPAAGAALLLRRGLEFPGARLKADAAAYGVFLGAASLVLAAVYSPSELHRYAEMLAYRAQHMARPMPAFLFGHVHPAGHPLYYAGAMLVKTPVPLLALTLAGFFAPALRRAQRSTLTAVLPMIFIVLGAAFAGKRQLGLRYILPVYPLFILIAALAAARLWETRRELRPWLAAAALWLAVDAASILPHNLAYFNALAGGPARGHALLADSNLDWGQSLPELARFVARNPGGVILSYFGRDCPSAHGLSIQDAFSTPGPCSSRGLLPVDLDREWLVVSATHRQGVYDGGPPEWGWLRSREPAAVLGHALFVYDVSGDDAAHRILAARYARAGMALHAQREFRRAEKITAAAHKG